MNALCYFSDHRIKSLLTKSHFVAPGSKEFNESHKQFLTGSSLANAIGYSPFKTPTETFYEYISVKRDNETPRPNIRSNFNTYVSHGNKYESVALEKWCQLNNVNAVKPGLITHPDPRYSWLAATPDAITCEALGLSPTGPRVLEVKCPYKRLPSNFIPKYYVPQLQLQLAVTGLNYGMFIQYVPEGHYNNNNEILIQTPFTYSQEFFDQNLIKMERFWALVMNYRRHHIIPKFNIDSYVINGTAIEEVEEDYDDALFTFNLLTSQNIILQNIN